MTAWAPPPASLNATARPIPREPPVISAVLPCIGLSFRSAVQCLQSLFQRSAVLHVEEAQLPVDPLDQSGKRFFGAELYNGVDAHRGHSLNRLPPADGRDDLSDQQFPSPFPGMEAGGVAVGNHGAHAIPAFHSPEANFKTLC